MKIESICKKIVDALDPVEYQELTQMLLYEQRRVVDDFALTLQRTTRTQPVDVPAAKQEPEKRTITFSEDIGYGGYLGDNGRRYFFDYVSVPNEAGELEEWEILSYDESIASQHDEVFKVIGGERNEDDSYASVEVEVISMTCREFYDKYRPGSFGTLEVSEPKVCKLINEMFSYVLEADGQRIAFQGSDGMDYFEEHYKALGYKIEKIDRQNIND